jgi:hypothetical protein
MNPLPPAFSCLLVVLSLAFVPPAQASDFTIPCADARGCPDLVIDDVHLAAGGQTVERFAPDACAVQEGSTQAGVRQLLRFSTTTANLGLGDLVLGGPDTNPERYEWNPCHGHYHFKQAAAFRLWTPEAFAAWDALRQADPSPTADEVLAAHPELQAGLVKGEKRGICMTDSAPSGPNQHAPAVVPDPLPKYDTCATMQGLSVGWEDIYTPATDGQWIDVTGVAPGRYVLENEANAEHAFAELDYGNNRASVPVVVLPGPSNNGVADVGTPVEGAVQAATDTAGALLPEVHAAVRENATVEADGAAVSVQGDYSTDEGGFFLVTLPVFSVGAGVGPKSGVIL